MMDIYNTFMEAYTSWWIDTGLYNFGMAVSTAALTFMVGVVCYSWMKYEDTEEYKSLVQK